MLVAIQADGYVDGRYIYLRLPRCHEPKQRKKEERQEDVSTNSTTRPNGEAGFRLQTVFFTAGGGGAGCTSTDQRDTAKAKHATAIRSDQKYEQ